MDTLEKTLNEARGWRGALKGADLYRKYEEFKQRIAQLGLTPDRYGVAVNRLAKALGV